MPRPATCVEHSARLIEYEDSRPHGQNTRDGDTLLLAAGQTLDFVKRMILHGNGRKRLFDACANLVGREAKVFRAEGDIVTHDGGDGLIVGILEHHARALPDGKDAVLIARIEATYRDTSARGRKQRVDVLGQRRLARAIGAENGDELSGLDIQADVIEHAGCICLVRKRYVIERNLAWIVEAVTHALVLGHEVLDRLVEHEGEHVVDDDLERVEGKQDGNDHGCDRCHVRPRVYGVMSRLPTMAPASERTEPTMMPMSSVVRVLLVR